MFKKKNKVEEFETKCLVVLPKGGIVEVNQAAYDYIRDLERQIGEGQFHVLYVCDRKGCNGEEGCNNPECHYTTNIEHAVNFHKVLNDMYEENHYDEQ